MIVWPSRLTLCLRRLPRGLIVYSMSVVPSRCRALGQHAKGARFPKLQSYVGFRYACEGAVPGSPADALTSPKRLSKVSSARVTSLRVYC